MKIISINVDKLRQGSMRYESFRVWLLAESPDVVLCQEACSFRNGVCGPLLVIEGYAPIMDSEGHQTPNTSRLGSFAKANISCGFVKQYCPRWQEFQANDLTVHNVYFPSDSSKDAPKREKFLQELKIRIAESGGRVILAGDFNLAPTPLDCKNPSSNYVRPATLRAVKSLQNEAELFEATKPSEGERPVYTYEHFDFRCDLAFASRALEKSIEARYEHRTRRCRREGAKVPRNPSIKTPFTNHSGIVLSIAI